MLRVGLTGGLATGKSYVSKTLEGLGCPVLHADEVGHNTLLKSGAAYQPTIDAFGAGILGEHGEIDRRKLGALVFADPEKLALLNSFVHPAVWKAQDQWFAELERADPRSIGVVEAAILIETGSYRRYHRLILTVCGREIQITRALERGLEPGEIEARLARQLPDERKRMLADYVIDTSGTKQSTEKQTRAVWESLRSIAP